MRFPDGERAAGAPSHGVPPGIAARRLVAVPWRHAGLIAVCALAGGLASTLFWPRPAPVRLAAVRPHVQAIQDAAPPPVGGIALRLDPEPDVRADAGGTTPLADAGNASASLRLDAASPSDEIDAALRDAPPAAGRPLQALAGEAGSEHPGTTLPGLVAGLLLGLLAAGARELGGERMRSPREAEWALGAPVLGAIPTLSAKARDALLEPPRPKAEAA